MYDQAFLFLDFPLSHKHTIKITLYNQVVMSISFLLITIQACQFFFHRKCLITRTTEIKFPVGLEDLTSGCTPTTTHEHLQALPYLQHEHQSHIIHCILLWYNFCYIHTVCFIFKHKLRPLFCFLQLVYKKMWQKRVNSGANNLTVCLLSSLQESTPLIARSKYVTHSLC